MIRIILFFLIAVPCFLFTSCFVHDKIEVQTQQTSLLDLDYKIDNYGFSCGHATIDTALLFSPSMCELIIENAKENRNYNLIMETTESKWIELIQSDSVDISRSASIWLYYLSKEKIEMFDLVLLQNWGLSFREDQVDFWRNYFKKNNLK